MYSKNQVKLTRSLKLKKYRQKYNKFVCEGGKMAIEVLRHHRTFVDEVYVSEQFIDALTEDLKPMAQVVPLDVLRSMSSLESNKEAIAVCRMPPKEPVELNQNLAFYLDGVRDPGNLGTIIRTCDWFGLNKLYVSPDCVDVFNPKVVQATMGSIFGVGVVVLPIDQIPEIHKNINVMITEMQGVDYRIRPLTGPSLIVMGGESNGVSERIKNMGSVAISIPKGNTGGAESLNVAIATAIFAAHYTE